MVGLFSICRARPILDRRAETPQAREPLGSPIGFRAPPWQAFAGRMTG
jgi:hypothetical protein